MMRQVEMPPVYKPAEAEARWSRRWLEQKVFEGRIDQKRKPFSIVIPPPNITGSLHMGHALNNTIQDILTRWKRMQGFAACWFPGTDHAGIATQVVVERELRKEGKSRHDLGREAFVERVWAWREEYGGIIDDQLRKLGVSCDWSRYSFTMDEPRARAVLEAFVRLYEKGLIYRDEYIVNWCPRCQTALSDLEVEHRENEPPGMLYHLSYPLVSPVEGVDHITIATTRPETILADVAVAVHPDDSRYQKLIGREAVLPLGGRKLPIIADEWADPGVGTGAVKITPAHDPNDFEVGQRHGLARIMVIDSHGRMDLGKLAADDHLPKEKRKFVFDRYHGKDRFECREAILEDLREQGFLLKEEPWPSNPARCARSGDIIEPYLSVQWFMKMKPLAEPAIRVVKEGKIQFHPERFAKLYLDWMENIRDWCISRQLWWGHRIPAWYCPSCDKNLLQTGHGAGFHSEGETLPAVTETTWHILAGAKPIVSRQEPKSCLNCSGQDLIQDPDVLDTWFSSALWPLSVMGWPEDTEDLRTFYPTDVLSTGRDILYLWVSRMIMMGLEFRGEIPFGEVTIHSTILDREGRRMSKSKGTGVDPLDLIARHGTDATRFGIILMAQGQDVRFNEEKIEQARNFANKIWNAARFVLSNLPPRFSSLSAQEIHKRFGPDLAFYDRWILSRLGELVESVSSELEAYEFSRAASLLYDFFWDEFCDWYLELSKLSLQGEDGTRKEGTLAILYRVVSTSLVLLHPFMPFLTEEAWSTLSREEGLLAVAPWPQPFHLEDPEPGLMDCFRELVRAIRNLRAEAGVKPKEQIPVLLKTARSPWLDRMRLAAAFLTQASKVELLEEEDFVKKAISARFSGGSIYLPLEGLIDIPVEIRRLSTERDKSRQELEQVRRLLHDPNFTAKAREEVIERTREKEKTLCAKLERIKERLALLED